MKREVVWTLAMLLALMIVPPAAAAEPEPAAESEAPTVGVGVKLGGRSSMTSDGLGSVAAPSRSGSFLIPIVLGDGLRVEPHVSVSLARSSSTSPGADNTSVETNNDIWGLNAGASLHHLWSPYEATQGYVGLQVGVGYGEASYERIEANGDRSNSESSSRSLDAGPVIGGEYKPIETVAIGAEVGLAVHYNSNSYDSEGQGGLGGLGGTETSHVNIRSHGSIFTRVYLW